MKTVMERHNSNAGSRRSSKSSSKHVKVEHSVITTEELPQYRGNSSNDDKFRRSGANNMAPTIVQQITNPLGLKILIACMAAMAVIIMYLLIVVAHLQERVDALESS